MDERSDPIASGEPPSVSFRESVWRDLTSSSWRQRCLLLATVAWIAYEWGFGNETLTPWILVTVISNTSGVGSVIAVASVGFVFTTLQQALAGHIAVTGFSLFDRTAHAAWHRLETRLGEAPRGWNGLRLAAKALLVFTLGTTAVVLMQIMVTGDANADHHRGVVNQAAVLCGAVVGVLGGVLAAAVWAARTVPALEPATDWMIRILGNPLFWIGVLVIVTAANLVRRRIGERRLEAGQV